MHRSPSSMPLYFLITLLLVLLSSCGAPTTQPTPTNTLPTTTPSFQPTATSTPSHSIVTPSTTPSPTHTPQPTPSPVRPEIDPGSPLSVQAEWAGSNQEPVFDWSPDGSKLVFVASDGVHLLDTATFQPLWKGLMGKSVAFSANGKQVAIATGEQVEIRAAGDGKLETTLQEGPCAQAEWVGFQPNDKSLVVGRVNHDTDTAEFSWLNITKGTCSQPFASVKGSPNLTIQSFSLSLKRDFLLAVIEDQVFLWSTRSGKEAAHQQGQAAIFDSMGYRYAIKNQDTISIFVLSPREPLQTFQIPNSRAFGIGHVWDMLAVSTPDGSGQQIHFYDPENKSLSGILRDLPADTQVLSFSPDHQRLLVIARKHPDEPSLFMVLGLYSGLPSTGPQVSGHLQITRPAPTPAPLFPILFSPVNGHYPYPTPIATPAGEAQEYRLREWGEEQAIDLFQPLLEFATANDVLGASASRGSFMWPHDSIRIAALEYLLRFANTSNRPAVQWQLASANVILNRHDTDTWILDQIEQGLNEGSIDPSDIRINASLVPFGFKIQKSLIPALTPENSEWFGCSGAINPVLAPNLFGVQGTTQIVTLQSLWGGVGIVAAIHQDTQGHYQVIPIHNSYNFNVSQCQLVLVQDLTGDDRPEIWVEEYWHSGSMDSKDSYIYQWRDGQFVNIAGSPITTFDSPYKANILGPSGQAKTIEVTYHGPITGEGTVRYQWNGEEFIASSLISPTMFDSAGRVNPYFLSEAIEGGEYQQMAQQLSNILNDPKIGATLHPDDAAYLTFGLAVSEALQFKPAVARRILEDWLKSKSTGDSLEYANAVKSFLAAYQTETDLWQACLVVQDEHLPCPLPIVLRELARHTASQSNNNLPEILKGYGVNFSFTSSFHANDDDRLDWFLLPEHVPAAYYPKRAWLLLSNKDGYEAYPITLSGDESATPIEFKGAKLPGSRHAAFVLRMGDQLRVFRVLTSTNRNKTEIILYSFNISAYQELIGEDSYDLLVWHDADRYAAPEWMHWDSTTGQFWTYDYAEHLVMTDKPQEAIRVISASLDRINALQADDYAYIKASEIPRLQYLFGLAYERIGDQDHAARIYYELWHTPSSGEYEHFNQPYAIMAREKLERIEPK